MKILQIFRTATVMDAALTILIHRGAIARPLGPIQKVSTQEWHAVLAEAAYVAMMTMHLTLDMAAVPHMLKGK